MPQNSILRWRDGKGWLILSGGGDPTSEHGLDITALALARNSLGESIAYLYTAPEAEAAETHLEMLNSMGAPTGYLIDPVNDDPDESAELLADAGLIILGDSAEPDRLLEGLNSPLLRAIDNAFQRGAHIWGIGAGAAVLGGFTEVGVGLGWVIGAVVVPRFGDQDSSYVMLAIQNEAPDSYGLGIDGDSALALGPTGLVQRWGAGQITLRVFNQSR
jgi:hypothetical protein